MKPVYYRVISCVYDVNFWIFNANVQFSAAVLVMCVVKGHWKSRSHSMVKPCLDKKRHFPHFGTFDLKGTYFHWYYCYFSCLFTHVHYAEERNQMFDLRNIFWCICSGTPDAMALSISYSVSQISVRACCCPSWKHWILQLEVGATEQTKLTVELCKDKNRCHFALYLFKQAWYAIMQNTSDICSLNYATRIWKSLCWVSCGSNAQQTLLTSGFSSAVFSIRGGRRPKCRPRCQHHKKVIHLQHESPAVKGGIIDVLFLKSNQTPCI